MSDSGNGIKSSGQTNDVISGSVSVLQSDKSVDSINALQNETIDDMEEPCSIKSSDVIWSDKPGEWAEGYPVGNGRIGGMVLGDPLKERVALNHDLLWRRFWSYQERRLGVDLPAIRELCKQGKWDEAQVMVRKKLARCGEAVYINPFVPAGDLGIYPYHGSNPITDYERSIDMDTGIVEVKYKAAGISFKREYFCSWPAGVLVIRLSSQYCGSVSGEVTLSRLLDPDCIVQGSSKLGEVVMECEFEEGVRSAVVVKAIQRGGRLTGGRTEYAPPPGDMPEKTLKFEYIFRGAEEPYDPVGVSTCFDRCDEVILLVSIAADEECGPDTVEWCRSRLDSVCTDYETLKNEHILDHQGYYRRVRLDLGPEENDIPTSERVSKLNIESEVPGLLLQQLYNMGRYLAIASGRSVKGALKAPINLQGIWNQDRFPAWDCDYHLDLNVQMCYWSLDLMNLGDLMGPLAEWVDYLLPQGRIVAKDMCECRGVMFSLADARNLGNWDATAPFWSGGAPWLAQLLWIHWEHCRDRDYLRKMLYPFLKELALFYTDFLVEDEKGRLVTFPSASMEMGIKGRKHYSMMSSSSTMDLEFIREVFEHIIEAQGILNIAEDEDKAARWKDILSKIPLPVIDKDGCLQEWIEDHEPVDPGHRHRSHLVGLCPGDRITYEDTPEYAKGALKAIEKRHKFGLDRTQSLTFTWDAQLYARLYDAEKAWKQIEMMMKVNTLGNLLITCNDWAGIGYGLPWFRGTKLYQIEASINASAAVSEMLFQDRRGLLRILPALPKQWKKGNIYGLCGRGGFEVGIEWDGGFKNAVILSTLGSECHVKVFGVKPGRIAVENGGKKIDVDIDGDVIAFGTKSGEVYNLIKI